MAITYTVLPDMDICDLCVLERINDITGVTPSTGPDCENVVSSASAYVHLSPLSSHAGLRLRVPMLPWR